MNVHIERIAGVSALVYTHRAHGEKLWKVYLLSEVPEERREQARVKQERIASKRQCVVKQVKVPHPPWLVDALIGEQV